MGHSVRNVGVLAALALSAHASLAQQPAEARAANDAMPPFASTCVSCHGANGDPKLVDVPIIAGQQPLYLRNALYAYRMGHRTDGQAVVMQQIVKSLSDQDIEALAHWFGEQR